MKTLFISIIAAIVFSSTAFAGAGSLFKQGIGLADWTFHPSPPVSKNSASTRPLGSHAQTGSKSKRTDRRVSAR
jgi:hypothetical protein